MRFRFCGDADCPDWLLMQINTLSTISVKNLKELSQLVVQSLLGDELNDEKVMELTREVQLDANDAKACSSALSLILRSSACHGVRDAELRAELEQLGLERGRAAALGSLYNERRQELTSKLSSESLRLARPISTRASRIDPNTFAVEIQAWHTENSDNRTHSFTLNHSQMTLLISELKAVKARMEELQSKEERVL